MNDIDINKFESEFSGMADAAKTPYEIIKSNGRHLIDVGDVLEIWLTEHHCFLFEHPDMELIGGFAHFDKEEHEIMPHAFGLYYSDILPSRETN